MTAFESIMDFLDPEYHEDDDLLEKRVVTEAMKKSDRDKLPDSAFALPKKRKYPINDEESVRNGIKYFRFVPEDSPENSLLTIFTKLQRSLRLTSLSLRAIPSINSILMSR
jgi:hypothetical protein